MTLRELARQRLDHLQKRGVLKGAASTERTWLLSALQSTAEGRLIEPQVDTLKQLTARHRLWEGLATAWPPDHVSSVFGAVVASHRLAIVKHDDDWLTELHAGWKACPGDVHYLSRLRAEGEIGLGLAPGGPRPFGWSEEELSDLNDEGFLRADAPPDRAWRALAEKDFGAARQALAEYERGVVALQQKWEAEPSEGVRQILAFPGALFQLERRALAALLDRARP